MQAEHEMEHQLLLNVVVGQGAPILELLAGEGQVSLVRGDPKGKLVSEDSKRWNYCTNLSLS